MGRVREEISHGTEVCCSCVDPEVTDAAPGWDVWNELTELAKKETSMAFEELKQKQSVIWGTGPYQNITETITDIHELVIERLDSKPGVRWLDLACGTGAVAERAAQAGADVTGVDLAPVLIETARERAGELGIEIDYRVGDCENLEFEDGAFDVVSSTCGVMFAPDHEATARELARVVKPGGRIGLANWTPEGGIGAQFKVIAAFSPPSAEGVGDPFAWGSEAHVGALLGDAFELELERRISDLRLPSGEDHWQLFSSSFGPTRTLAQSLDDDRREEFHQAWVEFFESNYRTDGGIEQDREWLFVYGRRR